MTNTTAARRARLRQLVEARQGLLMPGAYVQVSLPLTTSSTLAIPTNSLIIGGEGVRVAVVGEDGRIGVTCEFCGVKREFDPAEVEGE